MSTFVMIFEFCVSGVFILNFACLCSLCNRCRLAICPNQILLYSILSYWLAGASMQIFNPIQLLLSQNVAYERKRKFSLLYYIEYSRLLGSVVHYKGHREKRKKTRKDLLVGLRLICI